MKNITLKTLVELLTLNPFVFIVEEQIVVPFSIEKGWYDFSAYEYHFSFTDNENLYYIKNKFHSCEFKDGFFFLTCKNGESFKTVSFKIMAAVHNFPEIS